MKVRPYFGKDIEKIREKLNLRKTQNVFYVVGTDFKSTYAKCKRKVELINNKENAN